MTECRACRDNEAGALGQDEWAVAELATGVVRINPVQYHRGSTFFVARTCVAELHDLPRDERLCFLADMAAVAQAVFRAFQPRKLNYECLGNTVPHLHWWITPRHHDDAQPGRPIWEDLDFLRAQWTGEFCVTSEQRERLRHQLLAALVEQDDGVVRALC
jgi:diadenosine tetraphosphate (Ap4A) HIT family hydrolase